MSSQRHAVSISDGATISYLEAGTGQPIVLLPGLGQTAAQFAMQIDEFSTAYRVISVDQRGHGESSKPSHGYRIARLAKDLHELLTQLELTKVVLLGHSMGCSVIWSYWDQLGGVQVAGLVLVDQPATLVADPTWPAGRARSLGAIFTPTSVYRDAARIASGQLDPAGTPTMSDTDRAFFARCDAQLPHEHRAALLINHAFQDWRDVISRITVPTLVVGGVMFPEGMEWIANHIVDSKLELFTLDELGSHFMFWENPAKFNAALWKFLGEMC